MNNRQIQINNNVYDSCSDIDQSNYNLSNSNSIDGFMNDNFQYDSPYKITFVRGSNSPITTSNNSDNNSDSDNDNSDSENIDSRNAIKRYKINIDTDIENDDIVLPDATHISEINIDDNNERIHKPSNTSSSSFTFRKLTYKEIEKSLEQYNIDDSFKYSNELEILITYLKGQKNLYIQSKNLTQYKLNLLTIPAILIASGITIIAPFISHYEWSGAIVSGVNATITLLISFLSYFKLESCHQTFSHLANQYDKLETSLEITNSKLMFMENQMEQNQLIMSKIREFEEKIFEIKESCVAFIPEELNKILRNENCVSIHVRRTDYLHVSTVLPPLSLEYYYQALEEIKFYDKVLIFSDDLKWCKENFEINNSIFIEENELVSMKIMQNCKSNIIANSTFSWWGAYLNEHNKTIMPLQWFGPAVTEPRPLNHYKLDHWIAI